MKILILTSSLLDDRKILYSGILSLVEDGHEIILWSTSYDNERYKDAWKDTGVLVEKFPKVLPLRFFPYDFLKKMNDEIFDLQFKTPTRLSIRRHLKSTPPKQYIRRLPKILSKICQKFITYEHFDNYANKKISSVIRSPESLERLKDLKPDVVLITGPNRYDEPAVAYEAQRLNIPVIAAVHSWDNLSTKTRMSVHYDAYMVWSEQMKKDLWDNYPYTIKDKVYVVGASQYDVFYNSDFFVSRKEFCSWYNLDESKKIILHALGSPNLIVEYPSAIEISNKVKEGYYGNNVQLIIRPHPQFDDGKLKELLGDLPSNIIVQSNIDADKPLSKRFQDRKQIFEWVNSFRHLDVLVNLSSSVVIDAAIFDKPIVNLNFDPEHGQPKQDMIKEINHLWTHFKPLAESGAMALVNNYIEMHNSIKLYLETPDLHSEKRKEIALFVCGYLDGNSGKRMAEAIKDFIIKQ